MKDTALPYTLPQEPGRWPAIILAVAMHALLFAFLWFGIHWVNDKPETIEAEVWSQRELQQAAPPLPSPVAAPEEPASVVKQTLPEVKTPPAVDSDIVLEQEKKKRLLKEKKEQEKKEEEKKIAEKEKKKKEEELAKKEKAEHLAEEKQDSLNKQADDKRKQLAEVKHRQDSIDAKNRAAERAKELERIKGESDSTSTNGTAHRSSSGAPNAANTAWVGRVTAKVKSNIVGVPIPSSVEGNTPVEFLVDLLPDGTVAGIRKIRSSGIAAFDETVRRAIEASQPYPADSSGKVPSSFTSTNKPKDSNHD